MQICHVEYHVQQRAYNASALPTTYNPDTVYYLPCRSATSKITSTARLQRQRAPHPPPSRICRRLAAATNPQYWHRTAMYHRQTDSAATPAITILIAQVHLRSTDFCWHRTATRPIIDSADMPAICRQIDSSSSVPDLLSPLSACTVLLPKSTSAAPACS